MYKLQTEQNNSFRINSNKNEPLDQIYSLANANVEMTYATVPGKHRTMAKYKQGDAETNLLV